MVILKMSSCVIIGISFITWRVFSKNAMVSWPVTIIIFMFCSKKEIGDILNDFGNFFVTSSVQGY